MTRSPWTASSTVRSARLLGGPGGQAADDHHGGHEGGDRGGAEPEAQRVGERGRSAMGQRGGLVGGEVRGDGVGRPIESLTACWVPDGSPDAASETREP